MTLFTLTSAAIVGSLLAAPAMAKVYTVGDNDGYGFGVPDGGTIDRWPGPGLDGTGYDGRDANERSATNGAQFTDVYSALLPALGPNAVSAGSFVFPLERAITDAELTVDAADLQAGETVRQVFLEPLDVDINGEPTNAFDRVDGFRNTAVFSFGLTPAQIAAANRAGAISVNITGSQDFIGFDYMAVEVSEVPLPGAVVLLGSALAGLSAWRRWASRAATGG